MKGNERVLFVGNMSCLCPQGGQMHQGQQPRQMGQQPMIPMWQTKRVVVTESTILFFPHAAFDQQTSFTGGIQGGSGLNDAFDDLAALVKNDALPDETLLPIISERMNNHRKALTTDRDSITSPPLLMYPASQRQVLLMSLESVSTMLQKFGLNVSIPLNVGRGVAIVNKQTREINYMMSPSFNDAFRFVRACSRYFTFIQQNPKLQINQTIINFLQESVNTITPSLTITFVSDDHELEVQMYRVLIENTFLINGLTIEFSISTFDGFQNLQKILTCLKAEQLLHLTIKNQNIASDKIFELYPLISFNSYLEYVNLSHNNLDDKGIELFARIFEHCIDLKRIDLSYNQVHGLDNNIQIFLMKAAHLLTKVSVDLSYNILEDASIPVFEARVLFEEQNQIQVLNLAHNKYSRQGTWRLFMGYVEAKSTQPSLTIVIFPLPVTVELFQNFHGTLVNYLQEYTPFFNDAIPCSKQQVQIDQQLQLPKDNETPIQIPKKSLLYLKDHIREVQDARAEQSVSITRRHSNKIPATTRKILDQVRTLTRLADEQFQKNDNDPNVEDIWYLTSQIADSPYQMPLKVISKIQEHVWHKLNEAILIRDHYSISYLAFSATNLEIDTTFFRDRYLRVTNRKRKIEERIMKVLNFEIEEPLINSELDDLIAECHRLDVRGFPLSALIFIKLERDLLIRQYALSGYDWTLEWEADPFGNAFAFIDRDIDKLDMNMPRQLAELQINMNLFIHTQRINYFELCFIRIEKYQEGLERLMHLLAEQEALKDDELITKVAIDKFSKEDSVKIEFFGKWAKSRLRFISHNQYLKYDYLLWRENKVDLQMNSVRHAVYHFCYKVRRKEIYLSICSLDKSFEDLTYEESLERIDRKDPSIKQFNEVEQCRFLLSDMRIKVKVRIYTKNPELPINLHEYLVNNDILIFPHLRLPEENQITNKSQIKDNRPDSILMWVNNPNISTLQRIDDEVYVHAVYEMEKSLRYIYRELAVLDNDQYETTLAYQSMMHIIDIVQRSPSPCLLADELYLQIYRYQNKLEVQDGHFAGEHQLYKVLAVFTLYLPPSRNLQRFMLAWLYQKSLRFQLQKPAKKTLQHLVTWEEIANGSNQYAMPDWLPDVNEIMQRFRCNPNVEILVQTADGLLHKVIVPEFSTAGELMEVVYNSEIIGGVEDKYAYWVYRQVAKPPILLPSGEEIRCFEEVPLLKEQGIMEGLSANSIGNPTASKHLFLRRRIYCAWYSFTNDIIKGQHFDLLFHELAKHYVDKDYLAQYYEKDGIISVSTLLYLTFTKIESNKKAIEVLRQNKKKGVSINEEEMKSQLLQDTLNNTMDEKAVRNKLREFIPVAYRQLIPQSDIQRVASMLIKSFSASSMEDLKQMFVSIMGVNPASFGTCFRVRAFESFQETEEIKTDTLLIVNTFGLTLFEWQGALQKPYKVFMYEEIIGMSITVNQMRIHVTDIEKQFRVVFTFSENRALECYTDMVSYMVLRTNEYIRPLYAYNELYRMTFKENIFLNEVPNQNQTVEYILAEMAKREQTANTTSSFFAQVNKVTRRGQMQEQMQKLNHRYYEDERFIQLLIKKHTGLTDEARKVSLNTLMFKHFPFHLDCPFIQMDKPRQTRQTEVSQFFGYDAPVMVQQLYEPKRDMFTKSLIPYDVHTATPSQSSKIGSPVKAPTTPQQQAQQAQRSNPLLDKYRNINDGLLQELKQDNSKIRPLVDQLSSKSAPRIQPTQNVPNQQGQQQPIQNPKDGQKERIPTNPSMDNSQLNNPFKQKSAFQEAFNKFNKTPSGTSGSENVRTPQSVSQSKSPIRQPIKRADATQPQNPSNFQGSLPSEVEVPNNKGVGGNTKPQGNVDPKNPTFGQTDTSPPLSKFQLPQNKPKTPETPIPIKHNADPNQVDLLIQPKQQQPIKSDEEKPVEPKKPSIAQKVRLPKGISPKKATSSSPEDQLKALYSRHRKGNESIDEDELENIPDTKPEAQAEDSNSASNKTGNSKKAGFNRPVFTKKQTLPDPAEATVAKLPIKRKEPVTPSTELPKQLQPPPLEEAKSQSSSKQSILQTKGDVKAAPNTDAKPEAKANPKSDVKLDPKPETLLQPPQVVEKPPPSLGTAVSNALTRFPGRSPQKQTQNSTSPAPIIRPQPAQPPSPKPIAKPPSPKPIPKEEVKEQPQFDNQSYSSGSGRRGTVRTIKTKKY